MKLPLPFRHVNVQRPAPVAGAVSRRTLVVSSHDLLHAAQLAGVLRRLAVRMAQREAEGWEALDHGEQERLTTARCRHLAAYYPEIETELRDLMEAGD